MSKTAKIGLTVVVLLIATVAVAVHWFLQANAGVILQPL